MKDKRQGNDLKVAWSIFMQDGEPFRLDGKDVSLYLKNMFGRKELNDFVTTGNIIQWTFYGKDQKNSGKYSLELVINEGEKGMITTDKCDFVNLVSCSCKLQGGEDAPNVETESIELTSTLEYVAGGGEYDDTALWRALDGKVDKVEGLGLSEENYTTEEKAKLAGLENYDDSELREAIEGLDNRVAAHSEEIVNLQENKADKSELTELSAEVDKKQDTISDLETIRSGAAKGATAIQEVKTINGQSIVGSGNVEIQGGGEPSQYIKDASKSADGNTLTLTKKDGSIVSFSPSGGGGMTTPSGDPMHYMYEAAGATYNATDADIPMEGVYGDSYVHKAKHWHLNELGDITNEEMREIYLFANMDNSVKGVRQLMQGTHTRTNIATWKGVWNNKINDAQLFGYASNLKTAILRNADVHYTNSDASFMFIGCNKLEKVFPTLDATSTTSFNEALDNCLNLREVRIKNVKVTIKFNASPFISKASILYLIQNSAATSAMVITLHADAYARLAEDADIVAALAEKTNVSLAK